MMSLWLVAAAVATCAPVAGDRIVAGDLARVWPGFAAVPGETPLGFAPIPGARRIFAPAELARLAARFAVAEPPPGGVCFERPTTPLTRERALAAMRAAQGLADARIEIVELSRYPVPAGDLAFPRESLRVPGAASPPGAPALWKGEVRYGGGKRFSVWARVVITGTRRRVVAATALRAGEPVAPESVRVEEFQGFPFGGRVAEAAAQVAGRRPRRTIPAGTAVPLDVLDEPAAVERGEAVRVEVTSGAARLAFTGRAETAGQTGETVRVLNPSSRRTFPARVAGKGSVQVRAGEVAP